MKPQVKPTDSLAALIEALLLCRLNLGTKVEARNCRKWLQIVRNVSKAKSARVGLYCELPSGLRDVREVNFSR